ncbi:DUF4097 family beta strand repeat-containing protein [Sinomonas sp. JGH33]|uniref:DUF4097 family beta strand repeat-containing protein n=1 Tax=Sinomonas terricola TaxID=3110330 RepID=A0ABU5T8Q4_9MICC|nr:DUF4097 family beta strand repeat-containing protein [Sinomonas sp. JGH33]MEA5456058.1 DUF4097 family beta strand repeat-containing protein [Sinomonas sp. JGH33]
MSTENWNVTEAQTITVDGVTSLRAGIVGGRLDVIVHDRTDAIIEISEVVGDAVAVSLDNGRLEVRHQVQGLEGWFKTLMSTVSGSSENHAVISIAIPAGVPVELGTVSGDGLASGTGPATRLNTVSGSVLGNGTRGELHLNTVSGDVIARAHEGILTAKTVSGEVTASGRLKDIRAKSVSGDLVFDTEGYCESLGASTVSGDVTIRLPRDIGVDLSATTVSGRIVVDESRFSSIKGRLETILGPDLKLMVLRTNTVSGNVSVVHAADGAAPGRADSSPEGEQAPE